MAATVAERRTLEVVVDPRSPAATLIAPLASVGVTVVEPSSHDVAVAHGQLVDELRAGRLRYAGHPALDAAAQHALTRPLAGGEAVERRRVDVDASPFIAAELAVWGLVVVGPTRAFTSHVACGGSDDDLGAWRPVLGARFDGADSAWSGSPADCGAKQSIRSCGARPVLRWKDSTW